MNRPELVPANGSHAPLSLWSHPQVRNTSCYMLHQSSIDPLLRRLLHGFWESPGIPPGSHGPAGLIPCPVARFRADAPAIHLSPEL